ncbi:MAG TPA: enoyl-CoA hydratase-related protein [Syntrophales bacterium]|nr:enoyl-CoA hydratase-related protein [Syntrophales bacterium]
MDNVIFEKKGQRAYVTLNRQNVLNALNSMTLDQLRDIFERIVDDSEVRVAILTGSGEKAFAAGADIQELIELVPARAKELGRKWHGLFNLIENMGKPVIAAINGLALGGGCELAMACDIRIAAENSKFALPELKLGVIPGGGGTQRLPRLVGKGMAKELILTGRMIGANEALRIGLVNRVVPALELMTVCEQMADEIIKAAPLAVQYSLEAINKGFYMSLEDGLQLETNLSALICSTEDMKEGTTAFIEKRKPKFRGR